MMLYSWIAEARRIARPQSKAVRINFRVLMSGWGPVDQRGDDKYGGRTLVIITRRVGAIGERGLIESTEVSSPPDRMTTVCGAFVHYL